MSKLVPGAKTLLEFPDNASHPDLGRVLNVLPQGAAAMLPEGRVTRTVTQSVTYLISVGGPVLRGAGSGIAASPGGATGVTVTPNPAHVIQGFAQPFTAVVTGNTDQDVTWSEDGDSREGTIGADGVLHTTVDIVSGPSLISFSACNVTAAADVELTATGSVLAWGFPGYFITQEKSSAVLSSAIYHLHNNEVWCWNPSQGAPNPMNGVFDSGWVWPSQPGYDMLFAAMPAGVTSDNSTIIVTAARVYLAVNESSANPGEFALYYMQTQNQGPWVTIPLPSEFTSITNVRAMISTMTAMPGVIVAEDATWDWGSGAPPDGIALIGVMGHYVVSCWTPENTLGGGPAWSAVADVYGTGEVTPAPVVGWGDHMHQFITLVDPNQPYAYFANLGEATIGLATAPVEATLGPDLTWDTAGTSWPSSLDLTKPFGILVRALPGDYCKTILWGWSSALHAPVVWPQDYNSGPGSGFTDPGSVYVPDDPKPIARVIPQMNAALAVLQEPMAGTPQLWTQSIQAGGWYAEMYFSADPAAAAIGDSISVVADIVTMMPSPATLDSVDWSASNMGSSWTLVSSDTSGNAVIQKLNDDGNDFDLSCNIAVTSPAYGGLNWVITLHINGSSWNNGDGVSAAIDDDYYDGSWWISDSWNDANAVLAIDQATGCLDTGDTISGNFMPTVQLPLNWTGRPDSGQFIVGDRGMLQQCLSQPN